MSVYVKKKFCVSHRYPPSLTSDYTRIECQYMLTNNSVCHRYPHRYAQCVPNMLHFPYVYKEVYFFACSVDVRGSEFAFGAGPDCPSVARADGAFESGVLSSSFQGT